MADFTTRERTTVRHEYLLPSPTNFIEYDKAVHVAQQQFKSVTGKPLYDNSIMIEAGDEHIIIYWEEEL